MKEINVELNEIEKFSALRERGIAPFFYKSIDSTNNEARRYAMEGGKAPAMFCAAAQTAGRGRMGRSFFSPHDTGIYMTLLLDITDDVPASTVKLTSAAAVAVSGAIQRSTGIELGIKWVNDLYLGGRKVCGILAESFFSDNRRYAVIGVGINLSTSDFPEELSGVAGSLGLSDTDSIRDRLTEQICAELYDAYRRVTDGDLSYIEEYRARSVVIGKRVTYTENGVSRRGLAVGVDDCGGLEIECDGGERRVLTSGEISLRLTEG
ncbi:MAG: biotin--[acetyl-CoA-carboxylase] ligase [Clostridia bacterium]|nr:biotin--[acetyl-CoA-carboxylase] ligase [Clostridia bacterium]